MNLDDADMEDWWDRFRVHPKFGDGFKFCYESYREDPIDEWGNRLFQNASVSPVKHLRTLAQATGVEISAIQLTSFMIQEFLEKNDVKKDFTEIQGFSNFLLQGILKKLHDLADEQGILPPPEMDEEEDNDDDDE